MDSNHDKVIQNHLCYRYTTRQKEGKFRYHIVAKSQMTMTERRLRMIRQTPEQIPNVKFETEKGQCQDQGAPASYLSSVIAA
jgi:hypothetical protein